MHMCGCGGFLKTRAPLRLILVTPPSVISQLKIDYFGIQNFSLVFSN